MRIKILTFRYSSTLAGFDESPLQTFARDKDILSFREHFFTVNDVPHLEASRFGIARRTTRLDQQLRL